MSNDQRPSMSAAEAKKRDDRTIALASRDLRNGKPFLLAQGSNGRVIHYSGDDICQYVDELFAHFLRGRSGQTS